MKVTYRSPGGRIEISSEVGTEKEAFALLARLEDLFEEPRCLQCESTRLRHDVRTVQGFTYYEIKCRSCGARIDFGQTRVGDQLYAKRRDESGEEIGKGGWYHFQQA